jgi:acetolactate synthase-1/2/3 large subunit
VALECAIDVWGREAPVATVAPFAPAPLAPDPEAVAKAAALLDRAARPLIVVGGGALDAAPALRALAEALAAPVMSFRRGRGVLPSDHPLAVSWPVGHRLWAEADAVLAVGTRLHVPLSAWGSDAGLKLIRLDVDAEEIERFRRPDAAIVADAALGLAALVEALPSRRRPARADIAAAQAWFTSELARLAPQMGFLGAVRAALPEDGIVVEDVTQMGFVGRLAFPVAAPRRYLSPGYQDNLGWGYGAALGAKAAMPDRAVVLLTGDGGFLYQAGEMATAMRHRIAVVVVVFDDGAFGNVRRIQAEHYGNRLIASDLRNPDFVRLAESFGMRAWRADTPDVLRAALDAALAHGEPALIHVRLGEMPSPWPLILLPRVRGFEEAWRRAWP